MRAKVALDIHGLFRRWLNSSPLPYDGVQDAMHRPQVADGQMGYTPARDHRKQPRVKASPMVFMMKYNRHGWAKALGSYSHGPLVFAFSFFGSSIDSLPFFSNPDGETACKVCTELLRAQSRARTPTKQSWGDDLRSGDPESGSLSTCWWYLLSGC
ncbi:9430_t:CDS:2 [Acaulospora colombiana]|uniref:9430_t:CDS:1 n=1 Tax=Acaulospora colombiana TaxID=27376 RepID=A0ACA9MJA5_9GLOM|nr:9430_t:CDS:2 [Acaulospora colombiana]